MKRYAAVLADPLKGLKSDKAADRAEAAAVALAKYRTPPEFAATVEEVAIPAEESKLILAALAEGDWSERRRFDGPTATLSTFYYLRLTEKDGWKEPALPQPKPGQPPIDFGIVQKEAFAKWLAGSGKDYRIKKVVPKK